VALTLAQKQALKADIIAAADAACVALEASPADPDLADAVRKLYNLEASPAWTIWRKQVPLAEIAKKINGAELAGLSSLNHTRFQTIITLTNAANGLDASLADQRAFFDDIFSGAGGATTRANLLTLWKKLATRAEKLFSAGTGSDAAPATTAANVGNNFLLSTNDVLEAMTS
jgi:hypothetical protein